jgi:hypothetical protein
MFIFSREYLKLNKDDRKSALKDFKSPQFIFTLGFCIAGAFLALLGNLLTISAINLLGILLLVISGVVSFVLIWKKIKLGQC